MKTKERGKGLAIELAPRRSFDEMAEECRNGTGCPAGRWFACPFGASVPGDDLCALVSADSWEELAEKNSRQQAEQMQEVPSNASAKLLAERCRQGLCSKLDFTCPFGTECAAGHVPTEAQWAEALEAKWPPMLSSGFRLAGRSTPCAIPEKLGLYWMKHPYAFRPEASLVRVVDAAAPNMARIVLAEGGSVIVHLYDYLWAGPLPEEQEESNGGKG